MFKQFLKRKSLLLLIVILLIAGLFWIKSVNRCNRLSCLSFLDKQEFKIQEIYHEDSDIFRALYSKRDKLLLRVNVRSNISKEDSEKVIDREIIRVNGLFDRAISPYPGEISDVIECGQEFIPKVVDEVISGVEIVHYNAYLNDRLIMGTCDKTQITHEEFLMLFYCQDREQLFELELIRFISDENVEVFQKVLQSIKCTNYYYDSVF